jgi:hypothetical protein
MWINNFVNSNITRFLNNIYFVKRRTAFFPFGRKKNGFNGIDVDLSIINAFPVSWEDERLELLKTSRQSRIA